MLESLCPCEKRKRSMETLLHRTDRGWFFTWFGNRDVERGHWAERGKRAIEVGCLPYHEKGKFILVHVFLRDTCDICLCDFLDARAVAFQKIRWIAVFFVSHPFPQNFFLRVEPKDEGVENRILGFGQFFRKSRVGLERVQLLGEGIDGGSGRAALGSHEQPQSPRVVKIGADSTRHGISQTLFGANV